ncbi:MAG TPA: nuclear transport factor 2 family protein [Beijerinckiaceae bacterium]|nr:nuclear transport factor 2 family protein [Beijerinckiaceae bacterium]
MAGVQDVESFLRRAYDLRKDSNVDAIMDLFAPNATYHISGNDKASPLAARVSGHGDLRAALQRIVDHFDLVEYEIRNLVVQENRAAVHWTGTFRFRPNQEILTSDLAHFWTIDAGKVVALTEFCDTAHIAAVLASAKVTKDQPA